MEPHSWHRQPSLSSTRFRSTAYSSESSLIRGRYWRRCLELAESCIAILPTRFAYIGARKKISAYHFQTITSGFIASQYQGSGFKGLLNNWYLTLVKLEVDNLPRLPFLAREVMPHLSLETLFRQLFGFVQPC